MKQKLLLTITLWLTVLGSTWAQSNNALHFDGTNDYVDLPDFTTTHDFSQGFTFTAWVKWDAFTGNARVFEIGNGSGNVNNSIILRTDASSGHLMFQCANGTTNSEIKTDAAVVTTNTWHHVAATISSTGVATIYIDGAAVKSGSVSAPKNVTRANNWLGKSAWTADNYFKGTMDEVSIWHKTLTQAEIEAIKANGISSHTSQTGLLAYYTFNQGTAGGINTSVTTLTDATTNAKNGTLKDYTLSGTTSNWVAGFVAGTTPTYNLSATPTTLTLDAASGSNGSIAITSNTAWTISGSADWLTPSTTSGSNNSSVTFTTKSANTQTTARVASYTITGTGVASPVTVTVTQSAPAQSGITLTYTDISGAHVTYSNTPNSLDNILSGTPLNTIRAIEVTGGDFTTSDWEWLKANKESFTELTRFAILGTVNSAADVPECTVDNPIFLTNGALETLHLAKVNTIGMNALRGITSLKTVVLPNTDKIGVSAFQNCYALTSVAMPSIKHIQDNSFKDCTLLLNALVGSTPPTEMFPFAFSGCPSPRYLSYADANGNLIANGAAWEAAKEAYKAANDGNTGDNLWYGWTIDRPLYKVNITTPTNGTLTVGNPDAVVFGAYPAGANINVTATPSYGYKLANGSPRAYNTDDQSVEVTITNGSFTMPEYGVTVTATFEPKLSASANTVTLGKEAEQSQTVTVKSDNNHSITNINERPDWLQVDIATDGKESLIAFTTAKANPWGFEREVVFTLTAADANDITITVKQEAAPEVFTVSKTQATLGYQQGSTDIITITNNIPWSASTAPYSHLFSVSPTEGAGNAELTITALTENTGLTDIYGVISVNGETYPITQRFNAKELSISQTDILVGKEAGSSVQVQVTSSTDWQFDNINGHFYCEPAYGTGNATVTITANNAVSGYRNNVSTPVLTGADAYPVQLRITQKSDYMPLGDGTAENPFQISTLDNLRWMSENLDDNSPYLRFHYVLTNDIDAQETHNWPDGFRAISKSNTTSFAGTFNGKGYAISNLLGYGLFYKTAPEARIDSLALVNILVKGASRAGLVSYNEGTINACYVTGYMTGSGMGMLAYKNSGTISNCYTSGFIAGDNLAGLCFGNSGTISGSYTAVGSLNGMYNDGFVWQNHGTAHGYFNKELFADTNSPAIGLTTANMQQQANFEGWDFTNVWSMAGGKSFPRLQGVYNYPLLLPTYPIDGIPNVPYYANIEIVEMDYPVASVELTKAPEGMELIDRFIDWTPTTGGQYDVTLTITDTNGKAVAYTYTITVELWGEGTEANPYLIHTIAELDMMRQMQDGAHFLLMNDLDFAGTKYAYNPQYPEATGWQPIHNSDDAYFSSHFNGNGHIIKNLYINQPYGGSVGLFGPCFEATIKNLGLVDVNITGNTQCGGLTGIIEESTITSCYVTGSVKGNMRIGGLVGESKDSQVAKCYANATVEGDESVGGLIGYKNFVASLSNSYAAGTVNGRKYVGGLLGAGVNNFTSCYSVSVATDSAAYRGLFGDVSESSIINNYYLLEGNADVTNFEGTHLTAQQLMQQASFTDWDFTDTWQITEGQTLPRLRGMYNHPVVLPVADTAQINKPYTHTLRVVGMDNTVASVSISGVEGMTLSETDNTLTWTPTNANEPTLTVTATDANGAVTHHRQRIAVIPFDGEGTMDNPYQITTIAQLSAVRSYSDKCFILMNDLNFDGSEYCKANSQSGWLPIEKFTGMLYGNNHVIKNLYINRLDVDKTGLFGIIENALISVLGLAGVHIQGGDNTGAICGISSDATITHCYVSGTIHGSDVNTGGLAGFSQSSTISNCYNTASIYAAGGYLGGIAGVIESSGYIENCYNGGMLFNDEMGITGTIAGAHGSGTITNCFFHSDINPGTPACGSISTEVVPDNSKGLTTEQMKQAANFGAWDFTNMWQIREGQTYPALRIINNAPFAFAEEIHVGARQSLTNLLANDYDYETLQKKLVLRMLSTDGPGEITQNSCFAFPAGTATGTTTKLKYMVGEVTAPGDTLWGGQAVATIKKITNSTPGGGAGSVTIAEDNVLENYDALALANDADGDYLTIARMADGYLLHGTATIVNNRITYQPNADYYGNDELLYVITDGETEIGGQISVIITPVNDAPVLTAVSDKTIKEDETLTLTLADVTATDVDNDLSELSLAIAPGENYTVNGTTITPAENYHGTLSVGISVSDGELTSAQMTMTVTVLPVNDVPVLTAVSDKTINEDESITITMDDVTATDVDGDELQIVIGSETSGGEKSKAASKGTNYTVSGTTITPAADFHGTLKVNISVRDKEFGTDPMVMTITVLPVNDVPMITGVTNKTINEDESITLTMADVTAYDVDGDELQLVVYEPGMINGEEDGDNENTTPEPSNYTITGTTVTPNPNFHGTMEVWVTVTDGVIESYFKIGMTITVLPVNDEPVLTYVTNKSIKEGETLTLTMADVTATDADGDALSLVIANGANYTVSGNTITPASGFTGTLSVGISVTDGELTSNQMVMTVTVTALDVNSAPVLTAVANKSIKEGETLTLTMADVTATDADGDALSLVIANGANYTVSGNTITPASGFTGTLSVGISVTDGELTSNQMVMTVTVTALDVNSAPVLTAVANKSIKEGETLTLTMADVTATDADGDALTLVIANGNNYTVSGNTITPASGFTGTLSVGISVTDGELTSNQMVMTVTVTALDVNSAPVLTAVTSKSIKEGETLTLTMDDVTASDADGDALTLVIANGNNYTVSGTTITPASGFTGTLSVGISVTDGELTSNQMVMTVTVTALDVNSAPVLTAVTNKSIKEGETLTLSMADVTATDAEGDALSLVIASGDDYTVSGSTITPAEDFTGTLNVGIAVTDGELTSNQMVMTVTVTALDVNSAPVLTAVASKSIKEGETLTLTMADVTASDADGDALTIVIANGNNYTVSGTTITPASGFTGTLSVGISVTDGELTSNQMVMSVTVTPATGIDDNTAATVSAYPNPFTDYVVIESEEQIRSVSFINLLGKTVQHVSMPQAQVSTHNLLPGIYLIKVDFAKGKPVVIRMVKQ